MTGYHPQIVYHLAVAAVRVNFSLWHVLGRYLFSRNVVFSVSIVTFTFWRSLLSFVLLLLIISSREEADGTGIHSFIKCFKTMRRVGAMVLLGTMGGTIYTLSLTFGLKLTTAAVVGCVQPLIPIGVIVLSTLLTHMDIPVKNPSSLRYSDLGWISAVLIGAAVFSGGLPYDLKSIIGISILIIALISFALFLLLQSIVMQDLSPMAVTAAVHLVSAVEIAMLSPILAPNIVEESVFLFTQIEWFLGLLFCVLLITIFNYLILAITVQELGAFAVSIYGMLQPALTSACVWVFYGGEIPPSVWIGCIFMVISFLWRLLIHTTI